MGLLRIAERKAGRRPGRDGRLPVPTFALRLACAFAALLLLTAAFGANLWTDAAAARELTVATRQAREVLRAAGRLRAALVDQETGLRAFLLSGDPSFLAPYRDGAEAFGREGLSLLSLLRNEPERAAMASRAVDAGLAWQRGHARPVLALMEGDAAQQDVARAIEVSGAGKQALDAFRVALGELEAREAPLLTRREILREAAFDNIRSSIVWGGLLLSAAAVGLGLWLHRAVTAPMARLTEALHRLSHGEEVQIPCLGSRGEVGAIADALEVFRRRMAEAAELATAEARARGEKARVLAEAAHRSRAQERLLTAITSSMTDGIAAWNAHGRLLACNARYREMLDLPEEVAAPGRHHRDIGRHIAARGEYGPGDPRALAEARWQEARRGDGYVRERMRADGRVLRIAGRSLPDGGFVTTITDITAARAAERALQESERRFRLLAENAGDVVIRAARDGTRSYVSPAAERILGWRAEALVGCRPEEHAHPEDVPLLRDGVARLAAGTPELTVMYRMRRPDGSWIWVEVRARAHDDFGDGLGPGYVATIRDASERKRAEAELQAACAEMERMATTDALTGIPNRRCFEDAYAEAWRRCAREQLPLSLLLLDVDQFKAFNDLYGHPAGDACLRAVTAILSDVGQRGGDLPARMGGEEFALLMPTTDAAGAVAVAERLRGAIEAAALPHGGSAVAGVVTASIGVITAWPQPGADARERGALLSLADAALYAAKSQGRNRVVAAAPDPNEAAPRRQDEVHVA